MVRGRQQDPQARPSRQLEISRAFRRRRADELRELRDQIERLEHDKRLLCAEVEAVRAEQHVQQQRHLELETMLLQDAAAQQRRLSAVSASSEQQHTTCKRCDVLQAELDRLRRQQPDAEDGNIEPTDDTSAGPSSSTTPLTALSTVTPTFPPPPPLLPLPPPLPTADASVLQMWETSVRESGIEAPAAAAASGEGGKYFHYDEHGNWQINPAVRRLM